MAKLKDVLKLDGKAGAFSFTHGRDGFTVRKAEGMNGQRILANRVRQVFQSYQFKLLYCRFLGHIVIYICRHQSLEAILSWRVKPCLT
jgi:hypothetical protein